jgi:hypothetical protein
MNEQRLKDLRNTLRPLREARAILGDELMSDEDDGELMEAFISIDYMIENIKRATGLSPREPRPFGMDAAIIESLNTRFELGETVSAETDEFVRGHGAAYLRAIRERAWEDHTAMRGPGFRPPERPEAFERGPDHHPCRAPGRGGDSRTHSGGRSRGRRGDDLQTMQPHLFRQ